MVHIAADLPQFLQRRELVAYEQRLARTAYAYGVDLRRAQWLAMSTVGDPLTRAVDRRWTRLVSELDEECLRPPRKAPPTALLEEVVRLMHMLRAPLPTLRLLRTEVAHDWPVVTPLGTTKGGIHWLVLDLGRLMAMSAAERTFVLASGLGHLQCDHGSIFAAHLLGHRGRRMVATKTMLRPWAKVSVFSADRAGLLATCDLKASLAALERQHQEQPPWLPRWPKLEIRLQALREFDRSAIMARRRVLGELEGGFSIAPPRPERLGQRLRGAIRSMLRLGDEADLGQTSPSTPPDGGPEAKMYGSEPSADESAAKADEAEKATSGTPPEPPPPAEPPLDPETTERLEEALRDTWSLARCDQRLTRRLGLL